MSTICHENNNDLTQENHKFIVKYRQNFYDITEFWRKHPGGTNTLGGLKNADMTERFLKAPPHSNAAMYLMKEYELKTEELSEQRRTKPETGNVKEQSTDHNNHIELVEEVNDKINNNDQRVDESMEHLVDWSKAMIPQIKKITQEYDEWVHKPVDRPLRLFDSSYLEMLTKTPWWLIPTFWLPIIYKCLRTGIENEAESSGFSQHMGHFTMGIFYWTLLEYILHRWLFHMDTSGASAWLCTLHFLIHGLHHKVPFDEKRLVFPPLPGAVLVSSIYAPVSFILSSPRIVLAGALCGYLCYDMMHYYLHYGNPSFKHLYHMKRYHYQHHFAHQDQGYGVSSPLWDIIFNTRIYLRKLPFQLRWNYH